jgi:hypothetical protein
MAKMNAQQRNSLPKSNFGLPGVRKYPMPDKAHAANAKSRATQQENAGNLSASGKAQIDAKANRILGQHGIHRTAYMADGDMVQGNGNADTQPAMLTPGEFVMPKDSVKKIGVGKLRAMKDATHTPVNPTQPGYGVVRMADGDVVPDLFDSAEENIKKAKASDRPVSQTIGAYGAGAAKLSAGSLADAGRNLIVNPLKATGQFLGGVYQGATNPGEAPAASAAPASTDAAVPVAAPRQSGGASANFDTQADSQNAAASKQPSVVGVPQTAVQPGLGIANPPVQSKLVIGADGQATDAGNPIAGYGSFQSSDGRSASFSPGSVGVTQGTAPQIGINAAAYAPTQYSNPYGTKALQDQEERLKAMSNSTPNITDGLDLTSPQGVAALAARAAPVIMRNVAAKQAAREEGFGVQRQGQELQHEAALTADATQRANNADTNATQERVDAARNQAQLGIAGINADTTRKQVQIIPGRPIPQYDENGMRIGTDYEPGTVVSRDAGGNLVFTKQPTDTPTAAPKANVPTQSEFLLKAKLANPNATDAQLVDYYTKKYGKK